MTQPTVSKHWRKYARNIVSCVQSFFCETTHCRACVEFSSDCGTRGRRPVDVAVDHSIHRRLIAVSPQDDQRDLPAARHAASRSSATSDRVWSAENASPPCPYSFHRSAGSHDCQPGSSINHSRQCVTSTESSADHSVSSVNAFSLSARSPVFLRCPPPFFRPLPRQECKTRFIDPYTGYRMCHQNVKRFDGRRPVEYIIEIQRTKASGLYALTSVVWLCH